MVGVALIRHRTPHYRQLSGDVNTQYIRLWLLNAVISPCGFDILHIYPHYTTQKVEEFFSSIKGLSRKGSIKQAAQGESLAMKVWNWHSHICTLLLPSQKHFPIFMLWNQLERTVLQTQLQRQLRGLTHASKAGWGTSSSFSACHH